MFAVMCDNMIKKANEFNCDYEDHNLTLALNQFERATKRDQQYRNLNVDMLRL